MPERSSSYFPGLPEESPVEHVSKDLTWILDSRLAKN